MDNKKIKTSAELSVEEQNDLESIVVNFRGLVAQHGLRQRAQQFVTIASARETSNDSNVPKKRRHRRLSTASPPPQVLVANQQLDDSESCRPSVMRLVYLLTKLFAKLELISIQ